MKNPSTSLVSATSDIPPLIDAHGKPFGERRAILVPILCIIASFLAIQSFAVAVMAITARASRSSMTELVSTPANDKNSATGDSSSTAATSRPTTSDSVAEPKPAKEEVPAVATTDSDNPPAKASPPVGSAPASPVPIPVSTGSPLDDIRRKKNILVLPTKAGVFPLAEIPVAFPAALQLELGGGKIPGRGNLTIREVVSNDTSQKDWEIQQSLVNSVTGDAVIGRFRWRERMLTFEWIGAPNPALKYCGMTIRATGAVLIESEACQFQLPTENPSLKLRFSGTELTAAFGLPEPIPVPKEFWRAGVRLDGVPQVTYTGPQDLKVGQTETLKFPNPNIDGETLLEIDVTLIELQSKPAIKFSYFAVRPDPDLAKSGTVRIPVSRRLISEIANREDLVVRKLEDSLSKLNSASSTSNPPTSNPRSRFNQPPTSVTIDKKAARQKSKEAQIEDKLDQFAGTADWAATMTGGFDALEKSAQIELRFGLEYPTSDGLQNIEVARTKQYTN